MSIIRNLLLCAAAYAAPATAATEITTINFQANDFYNAFDGAPLTVSPVSGSFTISYDSSYSGTADLAVDAVSLTIGDHVYSTSDVTFMTSTGYGTREVSIGGKINGTMVGGSGTHDFWLNTSLFPDSTSSFWYYTPDTDASAVQQTLSVSFNTITLSAVPEPGSWALMIGGFGLVGGLARRRGQALIARA